jgi:hypothetical protein
MFEICLTDYPRLPVRAAAVVWWVKSVDSHNARTSLRKLIDYCTSDSTGSENDCIKVSHVERPNKKFAAKKT